MVITLYRNQSSIVSRVDTILVRCKQIFEIMQYILLISGYLFGSIPFGLLYGKMAGVDVRTAGSRNIGATNVSRLAGKIPGLLTLVSDALKAVIPMLLAAWLLPENQNKQLLVGLCGVAAFLGHLFPLYLLFKGGKGVATALGIYLYLQPLAALIAAAVFVLAVKTSGFVAVGSLLAALVMPVLIWFMSGDSQLTGVAAIISVLIWVKHHENISRLLRGEEKSWKKNDT